MLRLVFCVLAIAILGGALLAQSTVTQKVVPLTVVPDKGKPSVVNSITVIGENTGGVPCSDCVAGASGSTLGLPTPLFEITPGNNYQISAFLVDANYTGPCTITFEVRDKHHGLVASASETLMETAPTAILASASATVSTNAISGTGTVETLATCGHHKSHSRSTVFIACVTNPPRCRN